MAVLLFVIAVALGFIWLTLWDCHTQLARIAVALEREVQS